MQVITADPEHGALFQCMICGCDIVLRVVHTAVQVCSGRGMKFLSAVVEAVGKGVQLTLLMVLASESVAMMRCVPLSKMAMLAFTPPIAFALSPLTLIPVRLTAQYFCAHWSSLALPLTLEPFPHVWRV